MVPWNLSILPLNSKVMMWYLHYCRQVQRRSRETMYFCRRFKNGNVEHVPSPLVIRWHIPFFHPAWGWSCENYIPLGKKAIENVFFIEPMMCTRMNMRASVPISPAFPGVLKYRNSGGASNIGPVSHMTQQRRSPLAVQFSRAMILMNSAGSYREWVTPTIWKTVFRGLGRLKFYFLWRIKVCQWNRVFWVVSWAHTHQPALPPPPRHDIIPPTAEIDLIDLLINRLID